MSSEAVGWTFRHSPYTGAPFAVHLAIADSVNDQNDNELWARQKWLARKARTTRQTVNAALARMVDDGLLTLLEESSGGANRYRFAMPSTLDDQLAGVSSQATPVSRQATGGVASRDRGGVVSGDTEPKYLTQEDPNMNAATGVAAATLDVEELCSYLAERIERHRGGDRPVVTASWRKAMRLLVDRGPLHVDDPQPQAAAKVRASIDAVFDELNVPDGRGGFCWADQIRSAAALRDHWVQLREAYKRTTGSRVGRGAQAVDRVASRLTRESGVKSTRQPLGLLVEHEPKEITA